MVKNDNDLLKNNSYVLFFRSFGWIILSLIFCFLINNILVIGFDYPTFYNIFTDFDTSSFLVLFLYIIGFFTPISFVLLSSSSSLRIDAKKLHYFNIYLIRAFFWTIIFTGLIDFIIAFMRVEKLLPFLFDDYLTRALGRSIFVGLYVHIPLIILGFVTAFFTRTIGFTWLALLIVVGELLIVISRFIFSYEQSFMGDLVRYWYAALFLFASAYTLYEDGHVRVDVFFASMKNKTKSFINAFGSIFLGASTCIAIIFFGLDGKRSIINSPILNFEVTQTGTVGMFIKYQMAGFLAIFAITMLIQFISYYFKSIADYRNEPIISDNNENS